MNTSVIARARALACVIVAGTLCTLGSPNAQAFKVDTHIWIAQRIINDLAKSEAITIDVSGTARSAKLPPAVRDAILSHQQEFLLGSIGPDAFPGIYEGQMTIHPGLDKKDGWGTGDWLALLVRKAQTPAEVAFAYGALVHAASDVFAHTYVNSYAGHIYLLTDGELDVEKRHFLLEGYIASKMPPLRMSDGKPSGPLDKLLLRNGKLAVPTKLLRRAFYDDTIAARQWAKNGSPHIRGFHDLHRELKNLSKSGGPLDKLHTTAQKLVVYYYTGVQTSDADLKKLNESHQRVRDISNKSIDKLQEADRAFRGEAEKVISSAHQAGRSALKAAKDLLGPIQKASNGLTDFENRVLKAQGDVDKINARVCTYLCPPEPPDCRVPRLPGVPKPAHCSCTNVCGANPARTLPERILLQAQTDRKNAISLLDDKLSKYKEHMEIAFRVAKDIREAETKLAHNALDLVQGFSRDIDPLKSIVLTWIDGFDTAMDAYYLANGEAIRLAMIHKSPIPPLKDWVDCHFPAVIGVPSKVSDAKCTAMNAIAKIRETLDALKKLAVKDDPVLREIERVRTQVEEAIKIAAREEVMKFGSKLLGVDIQTLVDILSKDATASLLNQEFSHTEGGKKLVLFENLAGRIDREMRLRDSGPEAGTFDTLNYPVIFNAEVLSRLALLDAAGLKSITGISSFGTGQKSENIMFGMARSIDGNHQWLSNAPPYARRNGVSPSCGKNFGYPQQFALWKPGTSRRTFIGMFKGPLVPGLEVPESLALSPALPSTYPYRPTLKKPYPDWTAAHNDGKCTAKW